MNSSMVRMNNTLYPHRRVSTEGTKSCESSFESYELNPPSPINGPRRSWSKSHPRTNSWSYVIEDEDDQDDLDGDCGVAVTMLLPTSSPNEVKLTSSSSSTTIRDDDVNVHVNSGCSIEEITINSMEVVNSTYEMGPGEYIGARELMEGAPNSYTMIAKGEVKCFVLTLEDYTSLVSSGKTDQENKVEKKSEKKSHPKRKKRLSKEEKELRDINLANNWYGLTDLGPIGRGNFGLVHMVQDSSSDKDKKTFALKIVSHETIKKKNHLNRLMSEIDLLSSLKSPFISKLYGSREDSFGYYLLMEFVQGGED